MGPGCTGRAAAGQWLQQRQHGKPERSKRRTKDRLAGRAARTKWARGAAGSRLAGARLCRSRSGQRQHSGGTHSAELAAGIARPSNSSLNHVPIFELWRRASCAALPFVHVHHGQRGLACVSPPARMLGRGRGLPSLCPWRSPSADGLVQRCHMQAGWQGQGQERSQARQFHPHRTTAAHSQTRAKFFFFNNVLSFLRFMRVA